MNKDDIQKMVIISLFGTVCLPFGLRNNKNQPYKLRNHCYKLRNQCYKLRNLRY